LCDDSPSSLVRRHGKSGLDTLKEENDSQTILDDYRFEFFDLAENCIHPYRVELKCSECGKDIEVIVGCGSRFPSICEACAKKWKRKTFKAFYRGVCNFKNPKFLTLTLRYNKSAPEFVAKNRDIWQMRKELFRVLREIHKKAILGWVATIEYPNHIHMVIDSPYIDQALISREWQTITGDSFRVDIRQVQKYDYRGIAGYITKYITKATCWDGVDLDLSKGFHIKGQWGLVPGVKPPSLCHDGCLVWVYNPALMKLPFQSKLSVGRLYPPLIMNG
jgi:hypothetical protein